MLDPNNAVKINRKRQELQKKERDLYNEALNHLNTLNRLKLIRLQELINRLIKTIEQESMWTYLAPSSFTFRSGFTYEKSKNQITFDDNIVKASETGYNICENNTDFELMFILKYHELLVRLFNLEQKRNALINSVKDKIAEDKGKVLEFKKKTPPSDESHTLLDYFNIDDYLRFRGDLFARTYGSEGIFTLVKLLNDFTINPNPLAVYEELRNSDINPLMLSEVIEWAGTYSPQAQVVIAHIEAETQAYVAARQPHITHY